MRKIRDQRDKELEDTRFAGEEEMAQKRLDRDAEIADITKQEREQLEKVRTEKKDGGCKSVVVGCPGGSGT